MRLRLVDGNYDQPAPDERFEPDSTTLISAPRFLALDLPPPKQICGPLMDAGVTMIAGKSGVGKSLFALGMAAYISAGKNLATWHTPKARPVVYIDAENPPGNITARMKLLPIVSELGLINLHTMAEADQSFDFSKEEQRQWFVNSWIFECYDVFIFDTVSALLVSSDTCSVFDPHYWLQLEQFHNAFKSANKTVVWLDNLNKQGEVYGTALKHHKVDAMWLLEPWEDCPYLHTAAFKLSKGKVRGEEVIEDQDWYFHPENGWNIER